MTIGKAFARYLPVEPAALDWGMFVRDGGYNEVAAGGDYPAGEHPDSHMFMWDKGRVLDEYQIIYITRGEGVFEEEGKKPYLVKSGDLIFLKPGVWHRYCPSAEAGWDESWIGFSGAQAIQIVEKFFMNKGPILHLGYDESLLTKIHTVVDYIESSPPGFRQMMAGETIAILARIRSLDMRVNELTNGHEKKMDEARYYMLQNMGVEIDFEQLAKQLGMSYSRFRSVFKKHTGTSPLQYQLNIRLNKGKTLLRDTDLSVGEVAENLGFCSVYYFSRTFKKRLGVTPSEYRKT